MHWGFLHLRSTISWEYRRYRPRWSNGWWFQNVSNMFWFRGVSKVFFLTFPTENQQMWVKQCHQAPHFWWFIPPKKMVNFCKFGDGFDPIAFPTWVASQRGSPATWRQAHSASLVWTWMPLRWQEHPGKGCRNGSDSLFADLKNLKFGSCLMFSVHYPTSKSTQFHICLTEEDWRWWSPLTDSIMICSISGWKPASIGWKENREQKMGVP